jgi:hypothetical protein
VGTNFIGTTDNQPLEIAVDGAQVMQFQPAVVNALSDISPNVIGGDAGNMAAAGTQGATISGGGGTLNGNLGNGSAVGPNVVTADFGTISGGFMNLSSGPLSTVSGGQNNMATAQSASVVGGASNKATGRFSMIPGGNLNIAAGLGSFAAGSVANAASDGDFTWADAGSTAAFNSAGANEFAARAVGGVRFVTAVDINGNGTAGVSLPAGSSAWATLSDRNAKTNFKPVDGKEVVRELATIPVSTWNYKTQNPAVRHMGPMAQDFHAAFKVGEDNRHITTLDSEGVALAAIKGLYAMVQEKDAQIAALQRDGARRDAELTVLTRELAVEHARLDVLAHDGAKVQPAAMAGVKPLGASLAN